MYAKPKLTKQQADALVYAYNVSIIGANTTFSDATRRRFCTNQHDIMTELERLGMVRCEPTAPVGDNRWYRITLYGEQTALALEDA